MIWDALNVFAAVSPVRNRPSIGGVRCRRRWFVWILSGCLVAPAVAAERVVALGGDITEIVYALGAGARLVGVDSTSDYPAAATRLPQVGYLRRLGAEGVLALHPDLVLASQDAGPPAAMRQIAAGGAGIVRIEAPPGAPGVVVKIRRIGRQLGRSAAAETLAQDVERQWAAVAQRRMALPRHPHIVFLMRIGAGSPLAAGVDTAADQAIRLAGGINPAAYHGYRPVSAEGLVQLAPDVVLLMRQGSDGNPASVEAWPGMGQTPAGREHRIWLVDGEAMLGFGPRSPEAISRLQRRLADPAGR